MIGNLFCSAGYLPFIREKHPTGFSDLPPQPELFLVRATKIKPLIISFNKMHYKAVIFDLDGTLLDTIEDLTLCFNSIIEKRGFPVFDMDEYKLFVGVGAENVIRSIIPKEKITETLVKECLSEFKAVYAEGCLVHTKPYPEIDQLLRSLKEKGIKCSVLSNKPHDATVQCVYYYFPKVPFHNIIGKKEDTPLKPDPLLTLKILEEMQVSPNECVFLGDTATDMQTAANAGAFPVGALWGFRSVDELAEAGAKEVIANPLELLALFD